MQASSPIALLPIPAFSLVRLNQVSRRFVLLLLPLQQPERKLVEEHLPQFHQGWSYPDDVGTAAGVGNRIWEMASGCP
jgi:hypothetical protein